MAIETEEVRIPIVADLNEIFSDLARLHQVMESNQESVAVARRNAHREEEAAFKAQEERWKAANIRRVQAAREAEALLKEQAKQEAENARMSMDFVKQRARAWEEASKEQMRAQEEQANAEAAWFQAAINRQEESNKTEKEAAENRAIQSHLQFQAERKAIAEIEKAKKAADAEQAKRHDREEKARRKINAAWVDMFQMIRRNVASLAFEIPREWVEEFAEELPRMLLQGMKAVWEFFRDSDDLAKQLMEDFKKVGEEAQMTFTPEQLKNFAWMEAILEGVQVRLQRLGLLLVNEWAPQIQAAGFIAIKALFWIEDRLSSLLQFAYDFGHQWNLFFRNPILESIDAVVIAYGAMGKMLAQSGIPMMSDYGSKVFAASKMIRGMIEAHRQFEGNIQASGVPTLQGMSDALEEYNGKAEDFIKAMLKVQEKKDLGPPQHEKKKTWTNIDFDEDWKKMRAATKELGEWWESIRKTGDAATEAFDKTFGVMSTGAQKTSSILMGIPPHVRKAQEAYSRLTADARKGFDALNKTQEASLKRLAKLQADGADTTQIETMKKELTQLYEKDLAGLVDDFAAKQKAIRDQEKLEWHLFALDTAADVAGVFASAGESMLSMIESTSGRLGAMYTDVWMWTQSLAVAQTIAHSIVATMRAYSELGPVGGTVALIGGLGAVFTSLISTVSGLKMGTSSYHSSPTAPAAKIKKQAPVNSTPSNASRTTSSGGGAAVIEFRAKVLDEMLSQRIRDGADWGRNSRRTRIRGHGTVYGVN